MTRRERKILREKGVRYVPQVQDAHVVSEHAHHTKKESSFEHFYTKHYKQITFIPVCLLIIAVIFLFAQHALTGEFVQKGVSLKGGITLTVHSTSTLTSSDIQTQLSSKLGEEVNVRSLTQTGKQVGIIVEAANSKEKDIVSALTSIIGEFTNYSVEEMGSSLGASFFRETLFALAWAFFLIAVVVFIYFRTPVPCFGIIMSAVSDMVITLAVINLMGMKLETAGIAAFLMLIGYSVDTDILLTSRVIKGTQGTIFERMLSATKTGMTMTLTAIAAVVVGLVFTQSVMLQQIMTILLIGLCIDIFVTWLQNTGILMWYMKNKGAA